MSSDVAHLLRFFWAASGLAGIDGLFLIVLLRLV